MILTKWRATNRLTEARTVGNLGMLRKIPSLVWCPGGPWGLTVADASTNFEALEAVVKSNTEEYVSVSVDVLVSARTSFLH